jgi:hypothetical protein
MNALLAQIVNSPYRFTLYIHMLSYSSSSIELASGPKKGTSYRSSVAAVYPLANTPVSVERRRLTIQVRPPSQPAYPCQIAYKQHPRDEARPAKYDVYHEDKGEEQTTLPCVEPHIVALVLQNQK